jgi:hypothetical protein
MKKYLRSSVSVLLFLFLFGFLLYWKAFRGYFLSDDFVNFGYLHTNSGNWQVLLRNFYSNWLDIPMTSFYRPFITMSLYMDYLLWGTNAMGYHITNVVFHFLNAALIYGIVSRLLPSSLGAIKWMAAFLFISFPLHPEAVYWIIGRVDSQATFFYLGSLYYFMVYRHNSKRIYFYLSLTSAVIGLGSKETVVTLPVAIFLYELIVLQKMMPNLASILPTVKSTIKSTWMYGVLLVFYFMVRKYALGTFIGGYNNQAVHFDLLSELKKWFLPVFKLFFPWNQPYFVQLPYYDFIKYSYLFLWILLALVLLLNIKRIITRQFLFIISWFFVAIIPLSPVIFVGEDLQGSRHLYLISSIFIMGLVTLVAPVLQRLKLEGIRHYILLPVFIYIFAVQGIALEKNIDPWDVASQKMSQFPARLQELMDNRTLNGKIIVLDMVDNYYGAYFLRNGFGSITTKPFLTERLNDIHFYGPKSIEGYGSSLKEFVYYYPDTNDIYEYDFENNLFVRFKPESYVPPAIHKDVVQNANALASWRVSANITEVSPLKDSVMFKGQGDLYIYNKNIENLDNVNYVILTMRTVSEQKTDRARIYWETKNTTFNEGNRVDFPIKNDGKFYTYTIPLSSALNYPAMDVTGIQFNPFTKLTGGEFEIKEFKFIKQTYNNEGLPVWSKDFSGWQASSWGGGLQADNKNTLVRGTNASLYSPNVQFDPWKTNFISVKMRIKSSEGSTAKIYWTTEKKQMFNEIKKVEFPVLVDGQYHTYIVPVRNEISWWSGGQVTQFRLDPALREGEFEVERIELISGDDLMPQVNFAENGLGESSVHGKSVLNFKRIPYATDKLPITYNAENITNVRSLHIEISNTPFENPNGYQLSKQTIQEVNFEALKGTLGLDLANIKYKRGQYYIRMIGLNEQKVPVGNFSDPLVVLIE